MPQPNISQFILDARLPPAGLITSALVLAFQNDNFLMTKLHHRGWDIPGGHIELGETSLQAMLREVSEETSATLDRIEVLGYQLMRVLAPCPENYAYPCPDSYQLIYWAEVTCLAPFTPTEEAEDCALLPPQQARQTQWVRQNLPIYEAALNRARVASRG